MHANNESKDLLYEILIRPLIGIIWVNYNEAVIPNPLCGQFWFVWVLIFIRILHSFTSRLSLKGKLSYSLLPIIIVYVAYYFHIKTIFYIDRILIAYPFFALGNIIKQTNILDKVYALSRTTILHKKFLIIIMTILLPCFLYYINNKLFINKRFDMFYYELGKNVFWYYLMNIINIICLIILCTNFKQSKICTDISNGTFLILGLHLYMILYIWGRIWYFFIDPTRITMLACTLLVCIPLIQYSQKHIPMLIGK